MAISPEKFNALMVAIEEMGLQEELVTMADGPDGQSIITLTLSQDVPELELPVELQPFAPTAEQVEEAIRTGMTTKFTRRGVAYEIALGSFLRDRVGWSPENVELETNRSASFESQEDVLGYLSSKGQVFLQIFNDPRVVELTDDLQRHYI